MLIQIFGSKKCKSTQACHRFFSERSIAVSKLDIDEKMPSKGELDSIAKLLGGYENLIDTEGQAYKSGGFSYMEMSTEEIALNHPEVLKTPLVRTKVRASAGKDEKAWQEIVKLAKA